MLAFLGQARRKSPDYGGNFEGDGEDASCGVRGLGEIHAFGKDVL